MAKIEKTAKNKRKLTGIKLFEIKSLMPTELRITEVFTPGVIKKKSCIFGTGVLLSEGTKKDLNEQVKFLVPSMLYNVINENFPHDSYVGKTFEITKGEKVKGEQNSYYSFEVYEVEE